MRSAIRALSLLAILLFPLTTFAAESVSGRTIKYSNREGQTYWTTYKKDGTTFTKSTRTDGDGFIYDTGTWRMEGEAICERYTNWRGGRERCHAVNSGNPRTRRAAGRDTCSHQNSLCTQFCRSPAGVAQGQACNQACTQRLGSCLKTGTYYWRNAASVHGLVRR